MVAICTDVSIIKDEMAIEKLEDKYEFDLPQDVKSFFEVNNGGIPRKNLFTANGEEYEIRCFLSFNNDEYNSIKVPLASFQKETHGKIVPLAKDSGDSYYCLNIENLKVYYWSREDELYYCLAESFELFIEML